MVEKILRRSRDPQKIPRKNPQTPKNTREIASHISKHLLLKSLPARKQSREQDSDAKPSRTTKTAS
jgi:hypothetical protein